ncbi:MAG: hypothetical protein Kow0042_17960 [Calditrichia bacterium]
MNRRHFIKKSLAGSALFFLPGMGFMSCTKNVIEPTIDPITYNFCSPVDIPEEAGGFYVQFIEGRNYTPAALDVNSWKLKLKQTVGGNIVREKSLSFEEIASKYQSQETSFFHTFQCVGYTPGGFQISNGYFTGVPLRLYLENELGVDWSMAKRVYFRCFDNYNTNHIKERIMLDNPVPAYLVYKFDGIPLNDRRRGCLQHGYPVRMVVQEMLGMKSPKAIMEIEVSERDEKDGFWETRPVDSTQPEITWADMPPMKINSRIYRPVNYMKVKRNSNLLVSGIAFGGIHPLQKMEVGMARVKNRNDIVEPISWQKAEIQGPPDASAKPAFDDSDGSAFSAALQRLQAGPWPAPFVWSFWTLNLQIPASSGDYGLFARATDSAGNFQPLTENNARENSDGNNASHALIIQVE